MNAKDYSLGAKYLLEDRRQDREALLRYLKNNNWRPIYDYAVVDILSNYQTQDEDRIIIRSRPRTLEKTDAARPGLSAERQIPIYALQFLCLCTGQGDCPQAVRAQHICDSW